MTSVPVDGKEDDCCSLDFYNRRTRVKHNDETDSITFYFDYKKNSNSGGDSSPLLGSGGEVINWKVLRKLKQTERWGVVRHPMVLNFVNERLLDCALFYTLHIFAFGFFLLLLSSHIFARSVCKDWAVTVLLFIFIGFMLLKATVKARHPDNHMSFWFIIACTFNALTYTATFCYVWFPTLFSYDNYHQEVKSIILWFLPVVAIISAYLNFLYILRKSPYGIYIFMMARILRSFGHIATIWIPTLIAFSFAFHLIMRDSGIEPWESVDKDSNATVLHKLFVVLQAVTKTSTMMIGEVDANDILGTRQWIPSILVLAFEIITVILLMNLMVSLAVGDVSDLRSTAQDTLLQIKVNFVIEALQLSELYNIPNSVPIFKRTTNNVLILQRDASYRSFSSEVSLNPIDGPEDEKQGPGKAFHIAFLNQGMRVRVRPLRGRAQTVYFKNCAMELVETSDSGIAPYAGAEIVDKDCDGYWRRYAKWLIGLDWSGYIDL